MIQNQFGQFRLSKNVGAGAHRGKFYLVEIGPGLFPQETHVLELKVENGQEIELTQQAASKVMPAIGTVDAVTTFSITTGNDSLFIYHCEPTILLPGARLVSTTEIHVSENSTLIFSDIIGEPISTLDGPFQNSLLNNRIRIFCDGNLEFLDSLIVESNPVTSFSESWEHVFDNSKTTGSLYIVGNTPSDINTDQLVMPKAINSGIRELEIAFSRISPRLAIVRAKSENASTIKTYFGQITAYIADMRN